MTTKFICGFRNIAKQNQYSNIIQSNLSNNKIRKRIRCPFLQSNLTDISVIQLRRKLINQNH